MNKIKITESVAENAVNVKVNRLKSKHYKNEECVPSYVKAKNRSLFIIRCPTQGCAKVVQFALTVKKLKQLKGYKAPINLQKPKFANESDEDKTDAEIKVLYMKRAIKERGFKLFDKKDEPGKFEMFCAICSAAFDAKNK